MQIVRWLAVPIPAKKAECEVLPRRFVHTNCSTTGFKPVDRETKIVKDETQRWSPSLLCPSPSSPHTFHSISPPLQCEGNAMEGISMHLPKKQTFKRNRHARVVVLSVSLSIRRMQVHSSRRPLQHGRNKGALPLNVAVTHLGTQVPLAFENDHLRAQTTRNEITAWGRGGSTGFPDGGLFSKTWQKYRRSRGRSFRLRPPRPASASVDRALVGSRPTHRQATLPGTRVARYSRINPPHFSEI